MERRPGPKRNGRAGSRQERPRSEDGLCPRGTARRSRCLQRREPEHRQPDRHLAQRSRSTARSANRRRTGGFGDHAPNPLLAAGQQPGGQDDGTDVREDHAQTGVLETCGTNGQAAGGHGVEVMRCIDWTARADGSGGSGGEHQVESGLLQSQHGQQQRQPAAARGQRHGDDARRADRQHQQGRVRHHPAARQVRPHRQQHRAGTEHRRTRQPHRPTSGAVSRACPACDASRRVCHAAESTRALTASSPGDQPDSIPTARRADGIGR